MTVTEEAIRDIRAIPTWFEGLLYRSRLEARYAVFFKYLRDHGLDVLEDYECQGFEAAGQRYLPDFWLPGQQLIAEVKSSIDADPDGVKRWKALIEARNQERGVLLTDMRAGISEYLLIGPSADGGPPWEDDRSTWMVCPGGYHADIHPYPPIGCQSCRMTDGYWYADQRIADAFSHARSYRFGPVRRG